LEGSFGALVFLFVLRTIASLRQIDNAAPALEANGQCVGSMTHDSQRVGPLILDSNITRIRYAPSHASRT
jgi:hypothetical protein